MSKKEQKSNILNHDKKSSKSNSPTKGKYLLFSNTLIQYARLSSYPDPAQIYVELRWY